MIACLRKKRLKAVAFLLLSALILPLVLAASSCSDESIFYTATFYFVYCYEADGEDEAETLAGAVRSIGGAGYTLSYGGKYYIAASCYYSRTSALSVCESLNRRGLSCGILTAERESFSLTTSSARKNSQSLKGAIDSLYGFGKVLYECAASLDAGGSQSEAKSAVRSAQSVISALLRSDSCACFSPYLNYIYALCSDMVYSGYVYSRDVRYVQIASVDCILKITLA